MRKRRSPQCEIPHWLPLPWRTVGPLTSLLLRIGGLRTEFRDGIVGSTGDPDFRIVGLGDIALTRKPLDGYPTLLQGLSPLLSRADLVSGNLEAVLTMRTRRAGEAGSYLRADPEAVSAFPEHDGIVLSLAGNHSLDFGPEALADAIDVLKGAGIESCGHTSKGAEPGFTLMERSARRIAVVGFCDDHYPVPDEIVGPRPMLFDPKTVKSIVTRAASNADLVVVNLHWGYEFTPHPLLRHRDLARRVIEWGADVVLCHHAHVPMGVEFWQHGFIAHGLGNCVMRHSPYQSHGHPWTRRSFALELGFLGSELVQARLHPFSIDPEGKAMLDAPSDQRSFLRGISTVSARLNNTEFLRRMERNRLTAEAAAIVDAICDAAHRSESALQERLNTLSLPRQQSLLEFMDTELELMVIAAELRKLAACSSNATVLMSRFASVSTEMRAAATRVRGRMTNAMLLASRAP